jgi:glycosyltransferase involved in cell wall biosynthesis
MMYVKRLLFMTMFITYSAMAEYPEQHMVIVTLMYNVGSLCVDTLESIFMQQYTHYHVLLIDDCSTDNSASIAQQYIAERGMQERVRLIQNNRRRDVTANHEFAATLCDDDDIVIHLDGDGDRFAHGQVLSYINKIYTEHPSIWMTYGSFIKKSNGQREYHEPIPVDALRNRTVRSYTIPVHMRTFKAWLFKQIKHEDLLYKGNYHIYGADLAFLFPLFEMAGADHVHYIHDIVYIYNDRPNCHQALDYYLFHDVIGFFRGKPPYLALTAPIKKGSK